MDTEAASLPPLEHLFVPGADRTSLHVALTHGDGPLMLFLHGFPEFWRAWHRQLRDFALEYRCAALDLRGYNLSDKPAGADHYGMRAIVADLAAVIRALSPLAPAIVVGHDWGGIAAWHLARDRPELVERLAILNAPHPALFARELRRSFRQQLASGYALFFQIPRLAEFALRAGRCALLRAMVFGLTRDPAAFTPVLRAAYLAAWRQPGALRAGLNYYRCPENRRMLRARPETWSIDVPALVLWGDADIALRTGNLEGLGDVVRHLELHRHATATHWIVHEEPAWVDHHLRRFLGRSRVPTYP